MAINKETKTRQLALGFDHQKRSISQSENLQPKVVGFVDATTLELRKQAIERVRRSKIFEIAGMQKVLKG